MEKEIIFSSIEDMKEWMKRHKNIFISEYDYNPPEYCGDDLIDDGYIKLVYREVK